MKQTAPMPHSMERCVVAHGTRVRWRRSCMGPPGADENDQDGVGWVEIDAARGESPDDAYE